MAALSIPKLVFLVELIECCLWIPPAFSDITEVVYFSEPIDCFGIRFGIMFSLSSFYFIVFLGNPFTG